MRPTLRFAAFLMAAIAAVLLAACRRPAFLGGEVEAKGTVVCEGRYALCVAAACTPIPAVDAKTGKIVVAKALCECAVANGPSLGDLPCAARAPQGEGKYLVSTYSFGETATHPAMSCPGGTPWAYCYDQPCVVDPKDLSKAQCTCPIRTSGGFETLGGNCDKSKCGTLWSGATADAMAGAAKLLATGEGLKAVPANRCP
jgi:hypothetical protein